MKRPFHYIRRPMLLLEVLIAFALVALCALPLIYPHVYILRSEKKFISTVELDHLVNLLYADRLQRLYQNEIAWQDIESGQAVPVDSNLLQAIGYKEELPFHGSYRFIKVRQKPRVPKDKSAYLFRLEFTFSAKPGYFLEKDLKENNPTIVYKYMIPMERLQQ